MKRAQDTCPEEENEAKPTPSVALIPDDTCHIELLMDEMLLRIVQHVEDDYRDLVSLSHVSRHFNALATLNGFWISQFYQTLTGKQSSRVFFKARQFLLWLDQTIRNQTIDSNLFVFPRDDRDIARDYVLFTPDSTDEMRNKYPDTENCVEVVFHFGQRQDDSPASNASENTICERIANLLNQTFSDVIKALQRSQGITNADNDFKLEPLFPTFTAANLWFSIFRLCYIDSFNQHCYYQRCKHLKEIWDNLSIAQSREIGTLVVVANKPNSVDTPPVAWMRPTADELKRLPNHPKCYQCLLPMPMVIKNHFLRMAIDAVNPFRSLNTTFCSTTCLLNALKNDSAIAMPCGNNACTNHVSLRQALGYSLNDPPVTQKPRRRHFTLELPHLANISLGLLNSELLEDFLDKMSMHKRMQQQFGQDIGALDQDTEQEVAKPDEFKPIPYYLNKLPDDAHCSKAEEAYCLTHEAWKNRVETYRLIRGKLDDNPLPWEFFGSRLPALDIFFPFSFLTRMDTRTNEEIENCLEYKPLRFEAFCCAACKCYHDKELKEVPTLTPCLNKYCRRRFNLTQSMLSLECFALTFRGKHRGYVCDYYCRDAHLTQRLTLSKQERERRAQEHTQSSPKKRPRLASDD